MTERDLLKEACVRIICAHLEREGCDRVECDLSAPVEAPDIRYSRLGRRRTAKVQVDPYFGTDSERVADLERPFYRADTGQYALQSIADSSTRVAGWALSADVDELLYYHAALNHTEEELEDLLDIEDDLEFFSRLMVTRDHLSIIPMEPLREWFAGNQERFPTRPVSRGGRSGWFRLVPRTELEAAVPGVVDVGPIYSAVRHPERGLNRR